MIQLKNLTYIYRSGIEAIHEANAEIAPGIHLLAGENGAGKSTLLRLIAGLLIPSRGEVLIDGMNVASREPEVMQRVFIVTDDMTIPAASVFALAQKIASFYPRFSYEKLDETLAAFGLQSRVKFESLSLGNRRKSLIAFAMACGTDVLLLDEPTNGLDIGAKAVLRRLSMEWIVENPLRTLIISTHSVGEIENVTDGVIMLRRSNILLASERGEILSKLRFEKSLVPPSGALFTMPDAGMFRSILPADADSEETDIDYVLFYNALHSPASDRILKALS